MSKSKLPRATGHIRVDAMRYQAFVLPVETTTPPAPSDIDSVIPTQNPYVRSDSNHPVRAYSQALFPRSHSNIGYYDAFLSASDLRPAKRMKYDENATERLRAAQELQVTNQQEIDTFRSQLLQLLEDGYTTAATSGKLQFSLEKALFNSGLGSMQSPIIKMDSFKVVGYLYCAVLKEIAEIVSLRAAEGGKLTAENCWGSNDLIRYLIKKHLSIIFTSEAAHDCSATAHFPDNFSEESNCDEVALLVEANNYAGTTSGASSISDPSDFSFCCHYFECLKKKLVRVSRWKRKFSTVYHLEGTVRRSLQLALSLKAEGTELLSICNISNELNRLEADIIKCLSLKKRIKTECPSLFDDSVPLSVSRKLAVELGDDYSLLPFRFYEGDCLINSIELSTVWYQQLEKERSLPTQDATTYKTLLCTHSRLLIQSQDVEALELFVASSDWLDRISKIVNTRKQYNLSHMIEVVSKTQHMEIHKNNEVINELRSSSLIITKWISDVISPPLCNLLSISELVSLESALDILMNCPILNFGGWTNPSPSTNVSTPEQQQQSESNASDSTSLSLFFEKNSPMSNPKATPPALLESLWTRYAQVRVNINAYRTLDNCRAKLLKWKKKKTRFLTSIQTVSYNEVLSLYQEGHQMSQLFELYDDLLEISQVIEKYKSWCSEVDEFLLATQHVTLVNSRLRNLNSEGPNEHTNSAAAGDAEVDTIEDNALRRCNSGKLILADAYRVLNSLSCSGDVRPSVERLNNLLEMAESSCVLDQSRFKELRALSDHVEKWKRRSKECLKAKSATKSLERLKLVLLVEAKYFRVDMNLEKRLSQEFYCKIWRDRVISSCLAQLDEEEFTLAIELPLKEEFLSLLNAEKTIYGKPLPSETTAIAEDHLNIQEVLESKSEVDVLRILKHFQCKWNGEFTEFIATKPSLEDVESFKLRLVNYPVKLTSIIDSIDGIKSNHHLIEQAILAFPTKISVSSLESMQLRVASCPIPSTSWYKYEEMIITGRTIEAEIRARRACLKMTLLDVTALESYLISLDSEDLDFSCVVDPILEEIAIVVNWFNEKAKLLSSSFPQTIERLLSHSSKGSDLDIDPLELEKFSSEIKLAQSWRRLLLSLTRTRKIHYNEATLLLEMNRNGILLVESFNLENESVLFKREIENGIEALNKSASLITRRVYMSTILHNEVQLLEEVIATISELRRIAERLESFSLIEFPELLRRTLEECKFNESHLKLILCLTCCVPHIGCPIRNWGRRRFHKGCVPYVPLSAATELLQAITSQQNIEHHEMMFDWDLLGSEFPEHVTTIECLRNVSKELGLPPPLPLTVDEELVSMLKERLQRSLEWNNQYESVVGITLKGIPDFIWPSTSHEIWNLLSNKEEVIHTTIPCPSENLLPYWDNWMENCVDEHRCTTITQNISVADCFGIMLPSEILCSSLCSTSHVTKICGVSVRHNMSEEFTSFEEGSGGISYVHSTILDNLIERVYPHLTNSFHRSDILNALELYYAEGFIFENGHTRSLLKASLLIHIVFWKYVSETMRMEPSANVSLGSIIETKCPPSPQATIADILGYLELLELLPFQTPFKIELLNRAKYMIDMSNIARQCLTLLPVSKCDEDELPYEVPSGEDLHRVMSKEFGIEEPIRPPMPVGVDQLVVSNNRSLSDDQSLEATLAFIQSSGKAEFTSICDICADSTSPLNEVSIWIKCDTCKRWIHKSCAFLPENISDSILRYQYTCIVCLCHNQKSNFKVLFATNWYSVWLQSFIKGPKLRSHPSVGRLVELHRSNLLLQTEAELIGNHLGLIVLWLLDFSLCALNTDGKHVEIDPMPNWPSNAVVGGASKRPRVKTSASLHTPENPKVKGRAKRRGRTGKTAETKPIIEGFVKSSDVCEINNQIFILADKALEFVSFNQPITSVLDFTFNFVKECVRYKGDSSVPLSKLINANYRMVLNFGSGDEEYIASSTGNLKPANFLISAAFAGLYQHPLISFLFQVITADNNRYEMLNSMRLSLLPSNTEEIHAIFNTDITPVQWLQDPSLVFNRLIDHLDSSSTMSSSNLELEKLKECISTLSEKFNLFLRILASNAPRVTVGLGNIYVAGASNNDDDVVDSSLFKECYDSTAKVLSAELQKVGSLYIRMTTEGFVLSSNAAESMWEEWVSWWQNCLANSTLFYADRNSTPKESSLEQSYNSLRESRERVCELTVELGILCEILNSSRDVESPKLTENRGEQPPPPPYKVSVTYLKSFLEVIEPYKLENANVVYRYYLSQLDILKRLESLSNTKKQLSYDSYQSLLTLVEGSPCYLGPTGDRFISQINQVTKWVEAAREAVRTPITTDTTTAVNQALVVKKDCGGLVVDMTRSKIYGDVKRFIRDVKRHLQQPQDMMNAAAAQMSSMPWMGMGRYVYPYVPPYMTPDPYMMQADDPYGVYRNMQQQQQQQQQPSPPPPHN